MTFYAHSVPDQLPDNWQPLENNVFISHYREADGAVQTVETHLLEVAEFAKRFSDKIGLGAFGELLGLLHDAGKYSYKFQCYIKSQGLFKNTCNSLS